MSYASHLQSCIAGTWVFELYKSISKSLPNWFAILSFLKKQQKHASNSLAYDLAKFSNLANRGPPRAYLHAGFRRANACAIFSFRQTRTRRTLPPVSDLLLKECVGVVVWHVCCLAAANPLQGRGARRARLGQGHHQEFSAPPAASMLASYRLVRVRV